MNARATRRPKVRGGGSGGRGMRGGGGKGTDSEFPGCVLVLLVFASVAFIVAGGIVFAAVA